MIESVNQVTGILAFFRPPFGWRPLDFLNADDGILAHEFWIYGFFGFVLLGFRFLRRLGMQMGAGHSFWCPGMLGAHSGTQVGILVPRRARCTLRHTDRHVVVQVHVWAHGRAFTKCPGHI